MENFFYHLNPRLGSDGDLEAERQFLAEEQRMCKTRARKFSQETNRRRKVLDERRRQWDVQEQRLRENILQQRRQQMQDVTERFQRAHLPPSQRARPALRRNVMNLEDALHQIQSASGPLGRQDSFITSNINISRSCSPSPKSSSASKAWQRPALSAVEDFTRLLQDQSRTEKHPDLSPQGSHVSESLSSKDSLDEDPDPGPRNPQSFFLDPEKTRPDPRKQNDSCPASDAAATSGLLGDDPATSRKPFEPKLTPPHDETLLPKASWEFSVPNAEAAQHSCNLLALCELMSSDFRTSSPREHVVTAGDAAAANLQSCPDGETPPDAREQKDDDAKLLKFPSATEIPPPARNGKSSDASLVSPPKPNVFLSDSSTENLARDEADRQQDGYFLSSPKDASAFNNLNKGSDKHEKRLNTAPPPQACSSGFQSGGGEEELEEEEQKPPDSGAAATRAACEVRFIKGILKKPSRYRLDPAFAYGAGHFVFAKQVALAIRDSVELTRAKAKDADAASAVKKKLRWLDEEDAKEQSAARHARGKSSNPPQSRIHPEDHQPSPGAAPGAPRARPGATPAAAARYHFTREAWADVGALAALQQERSDEVKVPRGQARPGAPRAPRRDRPARGAAAAGLVSSRTRKGTVMRPQSATEASQIARAQGRMMAPRPPPRAEPSRAPSGLDLSGLQCRPAPAPEQTLRRSNSDVFLSAGANHAADANVTYALLPPSCPAPFSGPGLQELPGRRRGPAPGRNGLFLDCTPTEEEIWQLWHGVRSALTPRDGETPLRRQAPENGRVSRKPVQPPGPGNRRLPPASQPPKQLSRPCSHPSCPAIPSGGSEATARSHLDKAQGLAEEERDLVVAMETTQTQRPGQQQGLASLSSEEQRILQSLERLNQQLHCVQEYVGVHSGPVFLDQAFTGEMRVNLYKRCASSAHSRSRCQKKS